jgi:hypothetical protein
MLNQPGLSALHNARLQLEPPLNSSGATPTAVDLQQLVQEADLVGRKPVGTARLLVFAASIGWSLLQLW